MITNFDNIINETSKELLEAKIFKFNSIVNLLPSKLRSQIKLNQIVKEAKKYKRGYFALKKDDLRLLSSLDKKIAKVIIDFRANYIIPLGYIQYLIKKFGMVSAKDTTGISKREWEAIKRSGRKKIELRKHFPESVNEISKKLENARAIIKRLESIYRFLSFKDESLDKRIILSRLDRFINSSEFSQYAKLPDYLSQTEVSEIINTQKKAMAEISLKIKKLKDNPSVLNDISDIFDDLYSSKFISQNGRTIKIANVNITRFLFRKKMMDEIVSANPTLLKKIYREFIYNLIISEKKRMSLYKIEAKKIEEKVKFNEKEKKVWGTKKFAHPLSSEEGDFFLKITEKDFEKFYKKDEVGNDIVSNIYIKEPKKLVTSKKKIENEIYSFKIRLKELVGDKKFNEIKNSSILDTNKSLFDKLEKK